MTDKPHPEMGYRAVWASFGLAKQYSPARVEAAAERALLTGACRYKSVESILKNSLDRDAAVISRRHRLRHRRMTTSAARSTSSKENAMLTTTDDGKTARPCGCSAWWKR